MKGSRTKARQFALQLLFQLNPSTNGQPLPNLEQLKSQFSDFWQGVGESVHPEVMNYSEGIVNGVLEHRKAIDQTISQNAKHWRLDRMARVDLSILRLSVFELKYSKIPLNIVINEAVELAKGFSTAEASSFVNGILDAIAKGTE